MAFAMSALSGIRSAAAAKASAAAGKHYVVEIRDFIFDPAQLEIASGDRITWINRDIVPHTVTAIDRSWDSGTLERDESWETYVKEGMQPDYFCIFHPMMKARLKITSDVSS